MGNFSSSAAPTTTATTTLAPLQRPVVAVHASGCHTERTTFSITHQLFPSRFVVRDAHTGAVCYRKERKLLSTRQLLVDATQSTQLPVVNAKRSTRSSTTFSVRPGALDAGNELFTIDATITTDAVTDVRVAFTDLATGDSCCVTLVGNWCQHDASLWLDRTGASRVCVATVAPCHTSDTTPDSNKSASIRDEYTLDVAPNVDVVLVLVICMVLDERWRRYRSQHDR